MNSSVDNDNSPEDGFEEVVSKNKKNATVMATLVSKKANKVGICFTRVGDNNSSAFTQEELNKIIKLVGEVDNTAVLMPFNYNINQAISIRKAATGDWVAFGDIKNTRWGTDIQNQFKAHFTIWIASDSIGRNLRTLKEHLPLSGYLKMVNIQMRPHNLRESVNFIDSHNRAAEKIAATRAAATKKKSNDDLSSDSEDEQPPPLKKVRGKEPTGKTAIDDDSSEDEENADDTSAEESDEDDSEDEEDTAKKPKGKKGMTIAFPGGRGSGRGAAAVVVGGGVVVVVVGLAKANQDDIKAEGEAKKRDAKYDKLDDYCLSRAVANVTCNLKKGSKEKGKVYWQNIADKFEEIRATDLPDRPKRTWESCYNRWTRHILKSMNLFIPCYRHVKKNPKSGWANEKDFIEAAREEYMDKHDAVFKFEPCLEVLKSLPRFDPNLTAEEAAKQEERVVELADSGDENGATEQPTTGNNTAEVASVMGSTIPRPLGTKAFKEQQKKIMLEGISDEKKVQAIDRLTAAHKEFNSIAAERATVSAHVGFAKFLKDMGRIDEASNAMNRAMNAQMKPYSEYENLGKLDQAEAKADDEGAADEDDVDTLPPLGSSGSDTNGTDTVTGTDV
ncbi:unknown protein [Seminavis robusta]|uniref:No apical meristem-associated C-terminal domain-containing protein n=1 Tax=Seminavis robusta TaxID=568900 RepID=A0A9N8EKK2_9STRA|nr:unknown protein [Seminavis robusta]|eukprot:Sro1340_g264370.1 n/a (617) ;mRNA; f:2234-4589